MLEKYGVPLYEEQMVEYLLDHSMLPNTELMAEVNICRSSHSYKFFKASIYLYKVVAILYPSANTSPGLFKSAVFMLLDVETVPVEEVDILADG